MKLLTIEEQSELVPLGRSGTKNNLRNKAFKLGVGDVLFVSDADWAGFKYSEGTAIGSIVAHETMRFSARRHAFKNKKGWAIQRKK